MKKAARKAAPDPAREATALRTSFRRVRILHHAAAQSVRTPGMLEKLRRGDATIDAPVLNRILHRMVRNGWLKTSRAPGPGSRLPSAFSLTAKGRGVLDLARERLKGLAEALH